jgi:hypothetical protein
VAGLICGLIQPQAQRDKGRHASVAPQRSGRPDLTSARSRLRRSSPAASSSVVTINALLASTGIGLDQSATSRILT